MGKNNKKNNTKIKENETKQVEVQEDNGLFFAKINKSCLITYVGIFCAILSMYFAFTKVAFIEGCYVRYALACLVAAGICDMYDGKFARACKRTEEEKEFGVQLDSLADTICFIVTPIVLMFCMGMTKWYYLVAYTLLAICGVSRLGYFNIKADLDTAVKTYHGLPVTSTAITYPLIGLLHLFIAPENLYIIYYVVTLLTAALMVLNVRIPKLKGVAYTIVPILAAILILLLVVL